MARVADVAHSFFVEPDMAELSADAKYLLLWAIVTDHGNQAGLFTIARPIMLAETSLTPGRLAEALGQLREAGKLVYDERCGAVWVVNRAKRPRSKTEQIAKSIAAAVRGCPSALIREAFLERYRDVPWLRTHLREAEGALTRATPEPQLSLAEIPETDGESVNLTRTSGEVPGLGLGLKPSLEGQNGAAAPAREAPDAPVRFDGKPVPHDRLAMAQRLLDAFNEMAGTGYGGLTGRGQPSESLKRIIGALTDQPDVDETRWRAAVRWQLAHPFWEGKPDTGVVFGPKVVAKALESSTSGGSTTTGGSRRYARDPSRFDAVPVIKA